MTYDDMIVELTRECVRLKTKNTEPMYTGGTLLGMAKAFAIAGNLDEDTSYNLYDLAIELAK